MIGLSEIVVIVFVACIVGEKTIIQMLKTIFNIKQNSDKMHNKINHYLNYHDEEYHDAYEQHKKTKQQDDKFKE